MLFSHFKLKPIFEVFVHYNIDLHFGNVSRQFGKTINGKMQDSGTESLRSLMKWLLGRWYVQASLQAHRTSTGV